jgi:dienelactone hydrolase
MSLGPVGWSFGGAVVITAGAESDKVIGVCTVASQTYGTDGVTELSPRSLLLLHGTADTCLTDNCSKQLYRRAKEPRKIILFEGDDHSLSHNYDKAESAIYDFSINLFNSWGRDTGELQDSNSPTSQASTTGEKKRKHSLGGGNAGII